MSLSQMRDNRRGRRAGHMYEKGYPGTWESSSAPSERTPPRVGRRDRSEPRPGAKAVSAEETAEVVTRNEQSKDGTRSEGNEAKGTG